MTDQTIPADKVRGVINEIDGCLDGTFLNDQARRALEAAKVSIENILPAPPQPTRGLLGRWAHDGYGQVLIISDGVLDDGTVPVLLGGSDWTDPERVPFDSLAFPEQATNPEDVPAGEAWLVDVNAGELSLKSALAIKDSNDTWLTLEGATRVTLCSNGMITLISPLTPERPGKSDSDLQAKYDELEERWKHLDDLYYARGLVLDDLNDKYDELEKRWNHLDDLYSARGSFIDELRAKYQEAQERIKTLEQATPHTATTEAEYAALPDGSMIVDVDDDVWRKVLSGNWIQEVSYQMLSDAKLSGTTRTVLRYGWGDEQPAPAWRIEAHNPDNFRVGEYIIDIDGDSGTVTPEWIELWDTDEDTFGARRFAPFIVFPSKDVATPEAIKEANKARDKEMDK